MKQALAVLEPSSILLAISLAIVILSIRFWFKRDPAFVDLEALAGGNISEVKKQTLTMITELNKFLISLSTLMFGALGFYLTQFKNPPPNVYIKIAFLTSFLLLGGTYYFAFRVYSELAGELAQDALALRPGRSKVLYGLEMEFWCSIGASFILLAIFLTQILSQ